MRAMTTYISLEGSFLKRFFEEVDVEYVKEVFDYYLNTPLCVDGYFTVDYKSRYNIHTNESHKQSIYNTIVSYPQQLGIMPLSTLDLFDEILEVIHYEYKETLPEILRVVTHPKKIVSMGVLSISQIVIIECIHRE